MLRKNDREDGGRPPQKRTTKTMARTYNQECILAHALDLLGERWTLLILRELFLGPQRFGDLQAGLPGIGANLLSKRLKELEQAGLIIGPTSADSRGGYKLSSSGEDLRPTVRAMMHWSICYFMERPEASLAHQCIYSNDLRPDSVALVIELVAEECPDDTLNYVAHLMIDDLAYTVYYMNGEMIAQRGADAPAVATVSASVATFMQALRKELSLAEATKRMKFDGDEKVLSHLLACITHTDPVTKKARSKPTEKMKAAS